MKAAGEAEGWLPVLSSRAMGAPPLYGNLMNEPRVFRGNTNSINFWKKYKGATKPAEKQPRPRALLLPPLPPLTSSSRSATSSRRTGCEVWVEVPFLEETFIPRTADKGIQGEAVPCHVALPAPPPLPSGCNTGTQTVEAEIFDFDREAAPIVALLADRALEDALEEAETETVAEQSKKAKAISEAEASREAQAVAQFIKAQKAEQTQRRHQTDVLLSAMADLRHAQEKVLSRKAARKLLHGLDDAFQRKYSTPVNQITFECAVTDVILPKVVQKVLAVKKVFICAERLIENTKMEIKKLEEGRKAAAMALEYGKGRQTSVSPFPTEHLRRERITEMRNKVQLSFDSVEERQLVDWRTSAAETNTCHVFKSIPERVCQLFSIIGEGNVSELLELLDVELRKEKLQPVMYLESGAAFDELMALTGEVEFSQAALQSALESSTDAVRLLLESSRLTGTCARIVAQFSLEHWTVLPAPVTAPPIGVLLLSPNAPRSLLWGQGLELYEAAPASAFAEVSFITDEPVPFVVDLGLEAWLREKLLSLAGLPRASLLALRTQTSALFRGGMAEAIAGLRKADPLFEPFTLDSNPY